MNACLKELSAEFASVSLDDEQQKNEQNVNGVAREKLFGNPKRSKGHWVPGHKKITTHKKKYPSLRLKGSKVKGFRSQKFIFYFE